MSQPVGSRMPRLVALGAMIGAAAILAVTAFVLAQPTPAGAIPPYPDARRFCGGHATGAPTSGSAGPHIEWTAYYSLDAPDTVVAWYERRLASGLHRREGAHDIWRVSSNQPTAVLNVSAPADAGPLTGCTDRPPATARTVIVMSTMSRPQAQVATPANPRAGLGNGAPDPH